MIKTEFLRSQYFGRLVLFLPRVCMAAEGWICLLSQGSTVVSEGFGEMVSSFLIEPQGKSKCVQILSFSLVNKSRMLTKGRTIAGIFSEGI